MKQFNLEEWLENPNRKVVTKDGRPARIICWDKENTSLPIVSLIKDSEAGCSYEYINCVDIEGKSNTRLDDLFFAESEDEKIREELIAFLNYYHTGQGKTVVYDNDWISWLEKQREKFQYWKPSKEQLEALDYAYNSCPDTERGNYYEGVLETLIEDLHRLEKQMNKKPAGKVEPKFHEGDWITNSACTIKITSVDDRYYWYDNDCIGGDIESIDKEYHLWTIQDAKDGDVLAESKMGAILMFRGIGNTNWDDVIDYHCYYDCHLKDFIVQEGVEHWGDIENNQLVPATKEQRNILFQKMHEAGYEWDAEKKKLKEIVQKSADEIGNYDHEEVLQNIINEQNPAWSEENEPLKELAETYLAVFDKHFPILPTLKGKQLADYKNFLNQCQQILGLKYWGIHPTQARLFEKLSLLWAAWGTEHLKGLGQTDGDTDNEKQEWSEEDEKMIRSICCYLNEFGNWLSDKNEEKSQSIYKACDWLKSSIKPNYWKPSEFQLECLRRVILHQDTEIDNDNELEYVLTELYDNLKKL